jgi:hypothetical protein
MDNKHKNISFLITIFLFVGLGLTMAPVCADEPFAPKVELPKKLENRDMWQNVVNNWGVPSKEEVGIAAYPGSVIVALKDKGWMEANGEKMDTLPAITLATSDEMSKVTAYYKEKLKDWKYKNQMGMFDIFWTGKDDFNNMDVTEAATIPNLIIMKAFSVQTDFMPEAKTAITIVFKPVKN